MPTTKQLFESIETQMEFPETRHDYEHRPGFTGPFTGALIGHIEVDPETKDLKIIPLPEKETE